MPYGKGWQTPAPLAGYPHRRSRISLPLSLAGVVRFVRMTACGNMPSRMRLHTHPFSVYRPPGYGQMPSAIPRNAFMRKGCEGSLSSSENKGGHKKASSAHTKSRSHPASNRLRDLVRRAFPFSPKNPTLGRKGADGASNLFHTTP